jgi:phosphate starvation-inducible PhoH-like protein
MNVILPRTVGQQLYAKSLRSSLKPIIVATGPPGTGKSILACQAGAEQLYSKQVERLIITRPTVCVDEDLGYLPGTLEDKMNPYMLPIIDILTATFSKSKVKQMMTNGTIEIAPLAYMRGRTFENCFIIGDEMQNSTMNQMKMLLTRLGGDSRMVITGDVNQCDIKGVSGLADVVHKINMRRDDLEYLEHVCLDDFDIQRHAAVAEVLTMYD